MKSTLLKYLHIFLVISIVIFGCAKTETEEDMNKPIPPVAEKVEEHLVANGDTRIDNYYWMKLTDEQKNAAERDDQTNEVIAYLEAENDYTEQVLGHTDELQEKLYNEMYFEYFAGMNDYIIREDFEDRFIRGAIDLISNIEKDFG